MSWLEGSRARLRLLFGRRAAESRMHHEFRFHVDMETERLMREKGLDATEARRRALVAFGGEDKHKEALRDDRGLAWLGGFSLDLKLGFRMLRKYPGLTIVGGVAMAFAIWVGIMIFQVTGLFLHPTLPLPDGDRIVRLGYWDTEAHTEAPHALEEFIAWRGSLRSVTDLGAYRDVSPNLITRDGESRPVNGAEVTAEAFRIAPARPILGRTIARADEAAGAPSVVVLGYHLWKSRFDGDSSVIGRAVRLSEKEATVVGVMPKDFAFPVAHELWTQFQPTAFAAGPRQGPGINMFGKLAAGVSLEEANAEVDLLARRAAAESPETHRHLEASVTSYTGDLSGMSADEIAAFSTIFFFAFLLMFLVCSNVALLIFARAATRQSEIAVRSALGADRRRIVMQLFAEALVLGGLAALVGIAVADYALRTWAMEFLRMNMGTVPFWYDVGLSAETVVYALALTAFAAVIAGVLPALKITRGLSARLKQGTAGSSVKFGGVWTAVIIAQVAVTVAFPSVIAVELRELRRVQANEVPFADHEYLSVLVDMDIPVGSGMDGDTTRVQQLARYGRAVEELKRRVAAEPGVAGVTFVDRLPRMYHRYARVEVDIGSASTTARDGYTEPRWVSMALIDPSYFQVLQTPILAGRAFDASDAVLEPQVAIVDQGFVDRVLQGRNPIGRRIRHLPPPGDEENQDEPMSSYQIVGVVKELGMTHPLDHDETAGLYLPATGATALPLHMMVHAPGDPLALGQRVRELTAEVDPLLRLSGFQRVDRLSDDIIWLLRMWLRSSTFLAAIAVLLSLAGIYAVLSYTVSRRTREIGVRVALGASPRGLVMSIFRRPLTHVAMGIVAGTVLIVMLAILAANGDGGMAKVEGGFSAENIGLLLAYSSLMFGVCLLACVVPTLRALRVEPTQAMRTE